MSLTAMVPSRLFWKAIWSAMMSVSATTSTVASARFSSGTGSVVTISASSDGGSSTPGGRPGGLSCVVDGKRGAVGEGRRQHALDKRGENHRLGSLGEAVEEPRRVVGVHEDEPVAGAGEPCADFEGRALGGRGDQGDHRDPVHGLDLEAPGHEEPKSFETPGDGVIRGDGLVAGLAIDAEIDDHGFRPAAPADLPPGRENEIGRDAVVGAGDAPASVSRSRLEAGVYWTPAMGFCGLGGGWSLMA